MPLTGCLRLDDLRHLNAVWQQRQLGTPQPAAVIQKPEADARAALARLVEAGLVEARAERKGRSYYLSAATYRRLGERAAYARLRGFEALQQEQMTLQYVDAHGRITRGEAAELCKLSQIRRRVRCARADRGKLRRVGERRGARYERA